MSKPSNLIPLRDLIDMLIDIEQSGEGEQANDKLPVLAVWPDAAVLRFKSATIQTNNQRIPIHGVKVGEQFISVRLA